MQRVGSRAQVMHGNAKMTGGGLRKKDLKYNKQGKIVSKKMSTIAKNENRLQKAGYTTKKGIFKLFRKESETEGGSRKKKMVKEGIFGFRMKDILEGRVEKGKKTTLKVDGDSFPYGTYKKNLTKLKKYAKRMGYKKIVIVNFGEGDDTYKL